MSIDELTDMCWDAMRTSLFRRAVLGKRRCSELVMIALSRFPDAELEVAALSSAADRKARLALATRVEAAYRTKSPTADGTYNAVFMTIVLAWAARLIAAYLIRAWFSKQFSISAIRQQYGWSSDDK